MFGKRLKELREKKDLSQQQLGNLVNLSQQTIGHYETERAKPDIDTIQRFADIFGVSTDYILGRSMDKAPDNVIIAAHKSGDPLADLPPDARKSVEEFISLMRIKYKMDD